MAAGCATALCVDGSLGANRAGPVAVFWVEVGTYANKDMGQVLLSHTFVVFRNFFSCGVLFLGLRSARGK